jgi:hypothetical protein
MIVPEIARMGHRGCCAARARLEELVAIASRRVQFLDFAQKLGILPTRAPDLPALCLAQ